MIGALYAAGHSSMALATRFNTHDTTIRYHVRRSGVACRALSDAWKLRARIHGCNEQFFRKIDNERAAYWLGFLYADGAVIKRKNRPSNQLRLNLGAKDRAHVVLFRTHIEASQPVLTIRGDPLLILTSRALTSDLVRHGCGHRKARRMKFPNIHPRLLSHFMRGYFDGDGCIAITHNPAVIITGHRPFILEFQRRLMRHCGLAITALNTRSHTRCVSVCHGGRFQVRRIRSFLYKNASVLLERKKQSFDSV